MNKIFSCLLAFFIISLGNLQASSVFNLHNFDPSDSNRFTVSIKTFKPSRIYGGITNDPNAQNANKMDYGFGIGANFLNFEYSPIYNTGERFSLFYTFANGQAVNPYLGFSYIQNTKIYDRPTKRKIDGYDGLMGIEVGYLRYVVPYFEFMPVSGLWMFGVRFKLGIVVDKRGIPKLDKQQNGDNPDAENADGATANGEQQVPTPAAS
ncbi:MAG: hypothetical protein LBQ34_03385 [Alphaproteobacteria bacterium]|jgi:hypothetical protein|nr:hypothetical protein [Alphaproteobacteria bacterium]